MTSGTGEHERLSREEIKKRARQFERLIRRRAKRGEKEQQHDPERN